MVVERTRVLDAYKAARATQEHEAAVRDVAEAMGQAVETVQAVIDDEAATC